MPQDTVDNDVNNISLKKWSFGLLGKLENVDDGEKEAPSSRPCTVETFMSYLKASVPALNNIGGLNLRPNAQKPATIQSMLAINLSPRPGFISIAMWSESWLIVGRFTELEPTPAAWFGGRWLCRDRSLPIYQARTSWLFPTISRIFCILKGEAPEEEWLECNSLYQWNHSPDIITLIEVQDENGVLITERPVVSNGETSPHQKERLEKLTIYWSCPYDGKRWTKPGSNIRVAFLYDQMRSMNEAAAHLGNLSLDQVYKCSISRLLQVLVVLGSSWIQGTTYRCYRQSFINPRLGMIPRFYSSRSASVQHTWAARVSRLKNFK